MEINFSEGKKELDETSETESKEAMISEDGEIITDYEEDDTDYEKAKKDHNKEELKQQFKKIIVVATIIIVILALFILLIGAFSKRSYTYEDIEIIMTNAAKKYFADYSDYLPKEDNDTRNVPVENLVAGKYMKELSTYTKEGVTCDGYVTVQKIENSYDYRPYLNCGDNYETIELSKKISKEENLVTSGYGLYAVKGEYVFRGENVNNYIKLGSYIWRILKVNSNGNVVLVFDGRISSTSGPWDDRYNKAKDYQIGINNYATSRIKENLQKLYDNNLDENISLLSKSDKAKLEPFDLCVGKRLAKDTSKNNSTECSEKEKDQLMGLLTVSDYMMASVDQNCKSTLSESCQNYNYLNTEEILWWFATADKSNSYDSYYFEPGYGVRVKHASSSGYLRPVVYLKSNIFYKSGDGSQKKPYIIK